ncbi:MAG: histidinol-phosphate transaminase [Bdellovibrionaceae bacterium]|nr:histidinol-phosphate transaminase [Pseudobdellovibrionaceae bacterium]
MKVSPEILNLIPYKPGKPISETQREYGISKVYKLASNENPLGVSPKALEAVNQAVSRLNLYPDPTFYDLVGKVSELWQLPRNKITIGNGSDELFDLLIRIYCEPGEGIITTEAAFSAYPISAQAARVKTHVVPMKPGLKTDLAAMSEYLKKNREKDKIRLVFIPNPNNPTGTYVPAPEVDAFLKDWGNHDEILIIFDEAYTEFVRAKDYRPALDDMRRYSNVIVTRTMSKIFGLAGLRVGLMAGPEQAVDLINRVRKPFNVNELAQVAAVAALQDSDFIRRTIEITWQGLDYFYKELQKLGVPYVESQGNFVLFDTERDVMPVFESLLRRGVILRPVLNYGFKTHLRMSVGLPEENEAAIKALRDVFQEIPKRK